MSDLTLWDDTPDVEAPEKYTGPRWQKVPCAICGGELTRWMRLNSAGVIPGWYRWEFMQRTFTHLRTHWAEERMVAVIYGKQDHIV